MLVSDEHVRRFSKDEDHHVVLGEVSMELFFPLVDPGTLGLAAALGHGLKRSRSERTEQILCHGRGG